MDEEKEQKETEEQTADVEFEEVEPTEELRKLKERLKACEKQKQEYLDGWQRERAQFVNWRKQDEKDKFVFLKAANEQLITELLPVLGSFELAMTNTEVWEKVEKNWRVGVQYIYEQLKKILADNGVVEINPTGEKFDHLRDEAEGFETVFDETKNGIILSVIQKGYSLGGKVLRAPKVRVGELKRADS